MTDWTHTDAKDLYNVDAWGHGYFGINPAGHVVVSPDRDGDPQTEIDVVSLIEQIKRRGVDPPLLLRFDGILRSRVREMFDAFNKARLEYDYSAPYAAVFPIKVNQQRHLVDELMTEGAPLGMGIEVGSKPELLAVLGSYAKKDQLIICNGYKDKEYIEIVMLCQKLGAKAIIVIEKFSELATIQEVARELDIQPLLGVRTKLMAYGAGRWKESGGDRSKFGLSTREIVELVEKLEASEMLDCLQLLHFHLGSQITNIRAIKEALGEASRTLIALHGMGAAIRWLDVGGGLGVDYDGSSSDLDSSVNYSLQEYANDVVYHLKVACGSAGIPYPTILSESGRALTAHHAILVAEVLGVSGFDSVPKNFKPEADIQETDLILEFEEVCREIDEGNFLESYHDALELRERMMTLFRLGQADLRQRASAEELYWMACRKILAISRTLEYVPDDLEHLERSMADTYFLNYSIFQSMPDSWAIGQLFPVLPLQRLNEEPERRGILVDITCDSDGRVDRFIDMRETKHTLELHALKPEEPYYMGFFLVGAYQEILGDMHNLFGDTHVIHVDTGKPGHPKLSHYVAGDRVDEVLSYVEYFPADLKANLRRRVEQAIEEDRLSIEEGANLQRRFEAGLASYTYLLAPKRPATPQVNL